MNYIYTAVFTTDSDSGKILAKVPDLPGCISSGKDLKEAIEEITDAASLWLVSAEDREDPIPEPTPQNLLADHPYDARSFIQIDTIAYRAATDSRAVRKNVSLPAWMARLADKKGINCSQVLQEGLMKKIY